ncbi:MAG: GTPase HflX [Ruminococcus sp.]|jgi:GTP-binding protein HflX|nr:GTPase HflX [Ruminococcus sp.]
MNRIINDKENLSKVILVCADNGEYDAESSLKELEELAKTAGAETVGKVIQKRDSLDNATYIGSGRLEQLAEEASALEADFIIFDTDLSAVQMKNIEKVLPCKIIDRTTLILDIFAENARTAEGRLQVELAQYKYALPRLHGKGAEMSRLGGSSSGGLRARGAGETKLETDKRHIRRRIDALEAELEELQKRRDRHRARRKKDNILTAAIVGYTNVGKSTLMNRLSEAGVLVENKLFATLDTTSRAIELPDGRSVTIIDTVGLLRRLPHNLVEAFKSTLEEAASADLIINLIDISNPEGFEQSEVTAKLLTELGCGEIPRIDVLNKCDKVDVSGINPDGKTALISAKSGFGIDNLLETITRNLPVTGARLNLEIPYSETGMLNRIRENGTVYSENYAENGTIIDAFVDIRLLSSVKKFAV